MLGEENNLASVFWAYLSLIMAQFEKLSHWLTAEKVIHHFIEHTYAYLVWRVGSYASPSVCPCDTRPKFIIENNSYLRTIYHAGTRFGVVMVIVDV